MSVELKTTEAMFDFDGEVTLRVITGAVGGVVSTVQLAFTGELIVPAAFVPLTENVCLPSVNAV